MTDGGTVDAFVGVGVGVATGDTVGMSVTLATGGGRTGGDVDGAGVAIGRTRVRVIVIRWNKSLGYADTRRTPYVARKAVLALRTTIRPRSVAAMPPPPMPPVTRMYMFVLPARNARTTRLLGTPKMAATSP